MPDNVAAQPSPDTLPTASFYTDRWLAVQRELTAGQAVVIAHPQHIRYLTGFVSLAPGEREAFVVICPDTVYLMKASFSPLENEVPNLIVFNRIDTSSLQQHYKTIVTDQHITELLIDADQLVVSEWEVLQKLGLEMKNAKLEKLVERRALKDEKEMELLGVAGQIAANAWRAIQPFLQPGATEEQIARRLEIVMLEAGSAGPAFPTIVAIGDNAALPHHQPTSRPLTENTNILLDFGAIYQGYRSDITRTVWVGTQPSDTFLQIEKIVLEAYQASLSLLSPAPANATARPTPTAGDIDQAARQHISEAGYGDQFIHTTGHGVGLDIHEHPSLYRGHLTPITPGMVITIEPGLYLPGTMGYRYENTIAVTADGYRELTATQ